MTRIHLVRHGQAAAGFGAHKDPGLNDIGRQQAAAVAELLAPLGPLPIYSSPLARAYETAQPLASLWECEVLLEPRVAEYALRGMVLGECIAQQLEAAFAQQVRGLGKGQGEAGA